MKNALIVFLLFGLCVNQGQAQIKDFLKKVDEKVTEAVNELESGEIGEKLEEAVEQISEEIEEGFDESSGEESRESSNQLEETESSDNEEDEKDEESIAKSFNNALNGILGANGPSENISPNTEIISFKMESTIVESENRKIPQGSGYTALYAFDQWMTGMQMEYYEGTDDDKTTQTKFVLDLQEKTKTMCTQSEKGEWTGIKMWMSDYSIDLGKQGLSDEESISPTGNTKTIQGYLCEEFEINDGDLHGTIWATKEVNINLGKLSESLLGGIGFKMNNTRETNQYFAEYFWLESNLTDDGNKTRTVSIIKNIQTGAQIDQSAFDLNGIEIQSDMTK